MKSNKLMKVLSISALLGFALALSTPVFASSYNYNIGYMWTPHNDTHY